MCGSLIVTIASKKRVELEDFKKIQGMTHGRVQRMFVLIPIPPLT